MINALLSLGRQSLMNAQVGISVTGDNIANIGTEGYARRTVSYVTSPSITLGGLRIGTGASVESIRRHYDSLLESQYLTANGKSAYWSAQTATLYNVETLFNQSDDYGLSTALDKFMDSLSALGQAPADAATRQELLSYAQTLIDSLTTVQDSLQSSLQVMEQDLADKVEEANTLIERIAALNKSITSNPTSLELQDERDVAIRELSSLLDIKVIEQENSQVTVMTSSGLPLVDGAETFSLSLQGPGVETDLSKGSSFDGALYFDGQGADELLVEFVSAGPADGTASAATFRVSLDNGKTWLSGDDGSTLLFTAGGYDDRVEVEGIAIWFGQSNDSLANAATDIMTGDSFIVMPKSGVYWSTTTGGNVNITPLAGGDGRNNRLSGGELAGLLSARDEGLAVYSTVLDALAHELIWQMNYQHSQGAGLEHYSGSTAGNAVRDATIPLAKSSLAYADKLQSGGLSFAMYDADTGESLGLQSLDFSSITPGTANFDPELHSLQDVAAAVNASFSGNLTATVQDGRLQLQAADGVEFEFAGDSSGLLAALGLNTFFSGSGVTDMALDQRVTTNPSRINTATVDASGLVAESDNTNALALAALAEKKVSLDCRYTANSQTLSGHLHALVALVGADTDTAARNYTQTVALAQALDARQQEVAGVSMDEELTNLLRYQQAYRAAGTLIQTANELFDVIMSLKS